MLLVTTHEILIPTNTAIEAVPKADNALKNAKTYAAAILDLKGESGLSNILREWDILTEEISLNQERDILIHFYGKLRKKLNQLEPLREEDQEALLTAACQEFERRVSQKRKQRAGEDLENATQFIFEYFKVKCATKPEHFNLGIEVDNWIKDKNGWYLGVSLKRTLRERWKQTVSSAEELTRCRIKNIIHLINNDQDLSLDKVAEMGAQRHLIFVADESEVYRTHKQHPAVGSYLFKMSDLITQIKTRIR